MTISNGFYVTLKSVIFLVIAAVLFFMQNETGQIFVGALLIGAGIISLLFAFANQIIKAIAMRNYMNAGLEILTGIAMFFLGSLEYKATGILAFFFVCLAGAQLAFSLFSSYSWIRSNKVLSITRLLAPLLAVIPAGLILGNYFSSKWGINSEYMIIAIMFIITAIFNIYFIGLQSKLNYDREYPELNKTHHS